MRISFRSLLIGGFALAAAAVALAAGHATPVPRLHPQATTVRPRRVVTARRLRPRAHATPPGTPVRSTALFGERVFASSNVGFALANGNNAQYPAITTDGGLTWRIDGPQLHVDAADAPEAVGYVGTLDPHTFFAYGSSVLDVTTDSGHTWWETYMGELVMAVVPGFRHHLVAYVQQSVSNSGLNPAVTWQYVSRDGGRHWRYSSALGGG